MTLQPNTVAVLTPKPDGTEVVFVVVADHEAPCVKARLKEFGIVSRIVPAHQDDAPGRTWRPSLTLVKDRS